MLEREVRYKIDGKIKDSIIKSSEQVSTPTKCIDVCMGKYGFDSLDKLGYIIRLRAKNGNIIMESKRRIASNCWEEASISVDSIKEGYEFLKNIGLEPYLYINRTREVRQIKQAKIFLDEIDLLGSFVEFELEEGYELEHLKYYLKENNILSEPEKLYGDIFKERLQGEEFKRVFDKTLKEIMNNE